MAEKRYRTSFTLVDLSSWLIEDIALWSDENAKQAGFDAGTFQLLTARKEEGKEEEGEEFEGDGAGAHSRQVLYINRSIEQEQRHESKFMKAVKWTAKTVFGYSGHSYTDERGWFVPPGFVPLLGHLPYITYDFVTSIHAFTMRHGPHYKLLTASKEYAMTLVNEPVAAESILKETQYFSKVVIPGVDVNGELFHIGRSGVFTTNTGDEVWKLGHKILRPAFTLARMKSYIPAMGSETRRMCNTFDSMLAKSNEVIDGQKVYTFEAKFWMTRLAFQIVATTMFSYDLQILDDPASTHVFIDAMTFCLNESLRRLTRPKMLKKLAFSANKKFFGGISLMQNTVKEVLSERKKMIENKEEVPDDLLSFMLTAEDDNGQKLSETNMIDQVVTFMIAGHDTTANALCWTLYEIWKHPEVEKKVVDELFEVVGDDLDRLPTPDELQRMDYLTKVLKEVLRLHPPVGVLSKRCLKETEIDGKTFKKGEYTLVSVYSIHRDEKHWGKDPEKFDPERFDGSQSRHRFAWIPFSYGPRGCIGLQFAMVEARSVLAMMLRRYRVALHPQQDTVRYKPIAITMQPEALQLYVCERQRK
eukprot:CAMPEP_0113912384 /NCGR_PEP_ID=MMETSP0780_2-20120614/28897_1 /TAXON_ID=652834 /ORGANISM="Palpitomonas bilix" /LENGTH=586 /DNA_ID=CAMNT_0000909337 /DNA_START=488 /DNA_END=2248 /DNA_ORIENTATION=- /assembly_acc=CAM_ASM_000599